MARHVDAGGQIGVNREPAKPGGVAGNGHHDRAAGNGAGSLPEGSPAATYAAKWSRAAAAGSNLYVGRSGGSATPLLDSMIGHLPRRLPVVGRRVTIVEAAAGGGEQALHIASRVKKADVVAVDTSPDAARQIEARRDIHRKKIKPGSEITVVTGDVLRHLQAQEPDSITALHANSFWHFLTEQERAEQMAELRRVAEPGGLVAVSFKAGGDGLLSEPGTEVDGKDTKGLYAVPADGIRRLFVTDPDAVVKEFTASGLQVVRTIPFAIPHYDVPGKDGKFLGILAKNVA